MPDSSEIFLRMRSMQNTDLLQVLAWRNHPNVRRFMFSQYEIKPDEHFLWFELNRQNPKKHLLVFEANHNPQGVVCFSEVGGRGVVEWGFYLAPDAPKGSGRQLGRTALSHAFSQCNFHKVYGRTLVYNQRSIGLHQSLGFQLEGVLRDQHFDGERYHDVHCFGLLSKEWNCDN